MNFKSCRYLGIEKNQEHFNLIAACANLRRVPKLIEAYGIEMRKGIKSANTGTYKVKYITLLGDISEKNS